MVCDDCAYALPFTVRDYRPDLDAPLLRPFLASCSQPTLHARFLGAGPPDVRTLLGEPAPGSRSRHVIAISGPSRRVLGFGSLIEVDDGARIAVMVADEFQHHRVGLTLTESLMVTGREWGRVSLTASIEVNNAAAMRLVYSLPCPAKLMRADDQVLHVSIPLGDAVGTWASDLTWLPFSGAAPATAGGPAAR